MSKGLTIARAFHRSGHTVIGADFEPYHLPVSGRFSHSLHRFYRLSPPHSSPNSSAAYIRSLIRIVRKENVDLWISCSGVASAIEDGEAKEVLERVTSVRAVQFGVEVTGMLHEKDRFVECTRGVGLTVPETYPVRSVDEALEVLYPTPPSPPPPSLSPLPRKEKEQDKPQQQKPKPKHYILKFTGTSDILRSNLTLLPLPSPQQTTTHISRLSPSPTRPFILQQYIPGPEYCTHSIVVRGHILAFTACRSSDLLMHYRALSPHSPLFKAFLRYTQIYAERMGEEFTGHFSIDFLVDGDGEGMDEESTLTLDESGEGGGEKGVEVEELMRRIYPIECNPRAHTAAVLFAERSEEVAEAYLSLLDEGEDGKTKREIVMPGSETPGYYWVGHDLVTRVLLPVLYLLQGKLGIADVFANWVEFWDHLLYWKDGTYEIWDPWPFWWLYVVYWPGMFWISILTRNWWSRCNVSTTKLFRCS
jgi:hypothetical protein